MDEQAYIRIFSAAEKHTKLSLLKTAVLEIGIFIILLFCSFLTSAT